MNLKIFMIIVIILSLLLVFLIIKFILDMFRDSYIENRFSPYSLNSSKYSYTPFFEKIYSYIFKVIKRISALCKKSVVLKKYSEKYEKYIRYEQRQNIEAIDYIGFKIFISMLTGLFYILASTLRLKFNFAFLILFIILGFFIVDIYFMIEYKIRTKNIEDNLLSAIIIMNNSFKSNMNIIQAIDIVKSELVGPISDEFKKISMDISYGLTLEKAFDRFYRRINVEEVKYITSSLSLINKTGGNIVKVFGSIEKNFYDKKKIKEEMTSLVPIVLTIVLFFLNPEYFKPLLETGIGKVVILFIIILYVIYIFIVSKIMKVDMDD